MTPKDSRQKKTIAAEYVRMSTEGQQYSIGYQRAAIRAYATAHDIEIVRTYSDLAKSGLSLEARPALRRLLEDIECGRADFEMVIAYDVSRWGRFQDPDEGAFYEFLCRRSNIDVRYCAEPFEHVADLTREIFKSIKRSMAAEFSRELSSKVHDAACRKAALGRLSGGIPGFGLRRMFIDHESNRRTVLESGVQADPGRGHIVLVPGPPKEVEAVRRMFHLYVNENLAPGTIARTLNRDGIRNGFGRRWNSSGIRYVLQNERYTGTLIYNRRSGRLRSAQKLNPEDQWIRIPMAFPAIVSRRLYEAAQKQAAARRQRHNEASLLNLLRHVRDRHQRLSVKLLRAETERNYYPAYRRYFGSLANAYDKLGYTQTWRNRNLHQENIRRKIERDILSQMIAAFSHRRYVVGYDRRARLLVVNRSIFAIKLLPSTVTEHRKLPLWCQPAGSARRATATLVGRMDTAGGVMDYFLLPKRVTKAWIRIGGRFHDRLSRYRIQTLQEAILRLTDRVEQDRDRFHRQPTIERSGVGDELSRPTV